MFVSDFMLNSMDHMATGRHTGVLVPSFFVCRVESREEPGYEANQSSIFNILPVLLLLNIQIDNQILGHAHHLCFHYKKQTGHVNRHYVHHVCVK